MFKLTALPSFAFSTASTLFAEVSGFWIRACVKICLPALIIVCTVPTTVWAAPATPTGLAASSITVTSFTLKWTSVSGAASYQVFKAGVLAGAASTSSFNVTGLAPNTAYSMTVKAKDSAGTLSAASTALSVKTIADTSAPTTPTGLIASNIAAASFTLKWTTSADNVAVAGYLIFKNGTQIGTTATATFNINGLTPSTSYSITVKAKDATGNTSAASTALSVTTVADTIAPTVPVGLIASSIGPTSFVLNWTASTDNVAVASYLIFKNGTQVGTSTAPNFSVSGLTPSTAYSMTVKAKDAKGNSSASSAALSVTTITDTAAPSAPIGLIASAITSTAFTLKWSVSTDNVAVTLYNIYLGTTLIGTSTTASFNVTGLSPSTTYSLTVKAKDAANNLSPASVALSVVTSTAPGTPPVVTLTAPTINSVFTLPHSLTLTGTATATNATVTKVEFFNGTTKLGEGVSAPYQCAWSPTAAGLINLTARATDSNGLIATSAAVAIRLLPSLPYTADFEVAEGYTATSLNNQLGWLVPTGSAAISPTGAMHGTQSVTLNAQSPACEVDQEFGSLPPNPTIVYADLFAKPVAGVDYVTSTLLDVDSARVAFVKIGSIGQFAALDGDGLGSGTWKNVGPAVALDVTAAASTWQRITIRLNYTTRTWDIYINSAMIAADLKFRLNTASYFSWLSMKGHTAAAVQLDDIYVGASNPLFTDSNNNGIDDAWELAHNLSLNPDSRYGDPDGDGLNNLTEFLLGSNPQNSDNDANGLPDPWEHANLGFLKFSGSDDPFGSGRSLLQSYQQGLNPRNTNPSLYQDVSGSSQTPGPYLAIPIILPGIDPSSVAAYAQTLCFNDRGQIFYEGLTQQCYIWEKGVWTNAYPPGVQTPFRGKSSLGGNYAQRRILNNSGELLGYDSTTHYYGIYLNGQLEKKLWYSSSNSADTLYSDVLVESINDLAETSGETHGYAAWVGNPSDIVGDSPMLINNSNDLFAYFSSINDLGVRSSQGTETVFPIQPAHATAYHFFDLSDNQTVLGDVNYETIIDDFGRTSNWGYSFAWNAATGKTMNLSAVEEYYERTFGVTVNNRGDIHGIAPDEYGIPGPVVWRNAIEFDLSQFVINTGSLKTTLEAALGKTFSYDNITPIKINNPGQVLALYDNRILVLLTPIPSPCIDANRDGIIQPVSSDLSDQTTEGHPFRFWTNDDNDTETTTISSGSFPNVITTSQLYDGETTPVKTKDSSKKQIVSKRNLEDFARMWIPVSGLQDSLASGKLQIGLKWKSGYTGNPSINIYPSEDGNGSDSYLKDEATAQAQIVGVYNNAITDKNNRQTVDTTDTFIFKADYWSGAVTPFKCLLFEGVTEGKGQLVIVIYDQSGTVLGEGGGIWLELKDVKTMYQQYQATPTTLDKPFTVQVPFDPETASFRAMPDRPLFQPAIDEEKKVFVMVNGSNEEYRYATSVAETIFKRLYWEGYKGRIVSFRWETLQGPLDGGLPAQYNLNEWLAWSWGKSLADFMASNELPSDYVKNLGSHSLGCTVVGAALKRGMVANNIVLMQGAIPAGCFDASGGRNDPLSVNGYDQMWVREIDNYTPDFASEYGYRGYVTNSGQATIYSFYNVNDYALFAGPLQVWEGNQELYKPDSLPDFNTAYKYSRDGALPLEMRGQIYTKITGFVLRYAALPYESMAFIARSRSKALGARQGVRGIIAENYNIGAGSLTNLGDERRDHSGEFERHIQQLHPFYQRLADIIK